jgi:hypothetical protein
VAFQRPLHRFAVPLPHWHGGGTDADRSPPVPHPLAGEGDREAVEGALDQPIRTPMAPSTGRIAPEMNFDSSEARNRAA